MKIIILVAGRGERLGPLTSNTPKPLMDLGRGKTLFEEQLEQMQKSGVIDEVILVIGYLADQVEAKIKFWRQSGMKITTVYNPFYDMANNLISLWFAKYHMDDDFIIVNGDNVIAHHVFRDLVQKHKDGIVLTICKREKYGEDDMKVVLRDNEIIEVSKLIHPEKAHGESIGLVLVSGQRHRDIFKASLEKLARNKEYLNKFWLEVFNLMYKIGVSVRSFEIDKSHWYEVDFHPDLEDLRSKFKNAELFKPHAD